MLPSGHEHSFICSLSFNVIAVLKNNKKVHSQGVPFCKEKGEPIGMAPDRLAGTAVDCVISWKSWSLTFLALDIFA